jgi:hypothetical protein
LVSKFTKKVTADTRKLRQLSDTGRFARRWSEKRYAVAMQITRRELGAALLAAAPAAAQQATTAAQATPEDLLKAARDRLKSNADAMAAIDVPMATEPAFQFKA